MDNKSPAPVCAVCMHPKDRHAPECEKGILQAFRGYGFALPRAVTKDNWRNFFTRGTKYIPAPSRTGRETGGIYVTLHGFAQLMKANRKNPKVISYLADLLS